MTLRRHAGRDDVRGRGRSSSTLLCGIVGVGIGVGLRPSASSSPSWTDGATASILTWLPDGTTTLSN